MPQVIAPEFTESQVEDDAQDAIDLAVRLSGLIRRLPAAPARPDGAITADRSPSASGH